jgi:hypothetical protein
VCTGGEPMHHSGGLELTSHFLPNKMLKGPKEYAFLDAHDGGANLLKIFLTKPLNDPRGSSHIEVCSLKYPYKEFAWLFARIVGKDSMLLFQSMFFIFCITLFMRMSFLTGHVLFQMKSLFSWGIST